jgi:hypothetical protein
VNFNQLLFMPLTAPDGNSLKTVFWPTLFVWQNATLFHILDIIDTFDVLVNGCNDRPTRAKPKDKLPRASSSCFNHNDYK